jgi:hypothetical protein
MNAGISAQNGAKETPAFITAVYLGIVRIGNLIAMTRNLFVCSTGTMGGKGRIVQACHIHFPQAHAVFAEIDKIQAAVILTDAKEIVQRHTEDMTDNNHIHPGMADNQEIAGRPAYDLHKQGYYTGREIGETFPSWSPIGGHVGAASFEFCRVKPLYFIERETVPCPEIDFPQLVQGVDRFFPSFCYNPCSFKGAGKIAAEDPH